MRIYIALLTLLTLVSVGCSSQVSPSIDAGSSSHNTASLTLPEYLQHSINYLLEPDYPSDELWEKRFQNARATLTQEAWDSPTFQYLVRHKNQWGGPEVIKVTTLEAEDKNTLKGVLEINLQTGTGSFYKPAFLEFVAENLQGKWVYTRFGQLRIKKTDAPGTYATTHATMAISLDADGRVLPPQSDEELASYVLLRDEIDNYGLGLAVRMAELLTTGNLQPATSFMTNDALNSKAFRYLYDNRFWWDTPKVVAIEDLSVYDDKLDGILWMNLWEKIGTKGSYIEIQVELTSDGWRINKLGRLTVLKSTWPPSPPLPDAAIVVE